MDNYIQYHIHDDTSLLDSCTKFSDYVSKAVELGQKALASTNHGTLYNWEERLELCNKAGIKYIHGCEVYLTEKLWFDPIIDTESPEFKKMSKEQINVYIAENQRHVRDNYHTVLLAKNIEGLKEINSLVSISTNKEHMYHKPRISFDEFFNISDNVIKISACLASPLHRFRTECVDKQNMEETFDKLCEKYDFYEIQPHANSKEQAEYNKFLYELSKKKNKKLIVGCDVHSIDSYKEECRKILQRSKGIDFTSEDDFDLTYKSYDEILDCFNRQGALPYEVYKEALDNTNLLDEMTEYIVLDTSIKYPHMYDNDDAVMEKRTYDMLDEKVSSGIIKPQDKQKYKDNIEEEFRVFRKTNMMGFMLSMSEIVSDCKKKGIAFGFGRGSCGGSTVAYVTDITDIDPVRWNTVFSRFCNEDRVEIGDIDVDLYKTDRDVVYSYIINRFGDSKTAYVLALGKTKEKDAIDTIGRGLCYNWCVTRKSFKEKMEQRIQEVGEDRARAYKKSLIEELKKDPSNPYSLNKVAEIKAEYNEDTELAKKHYPDLFYYFDGLVDTYVSQSMHPAGIIASPITLSDNYGTLYDSDGHKILQLDMECVHNVGLAKYDLLGLKNVGIIDKTYKYIGKNYPHSYEVDWDDQRVWADMKKSPIGIFQFESPFAFQTLKKFDAKSIEDMSLVTAMIRPSGESYRNELMQHKFNKNPSPIIDELLKDNLGFLVYQEDTIKFLQQICGLSGSEADNVRRAIGRKQIDRLQAALPSILEGYCKKSDKPRAEAEEEAKAFLKVIEDSANYQFGYNHSIAYCMLGYMCAYLRYYYPVEFLTAFLNCSETEEDFANGDILAKTYKIKIIPPKFRYARAEYQPNPEQKVVYKGMKSIKFMNNQVAEDLYNLRDKKYNSFIELLYDLKEISINSRQLDILIKLDFFEEFGNSKTLLKIVECFDKFKQGNAKSIKKEQLVNDNILNGIVKRHSVGVTKSGKESVSYSQLDCFAILNECEEYLKGVGIKDFSYKEKANTQLEYFGYIGILTNKREDRPKLIVLDVKPLISKKSNRKWATQIVAQSIGSGIKNTFTIVNKNYNETINKLDVIFCENVEKQGSYWHITKYYRMVGV